MTDLEMQFALARLDGWEPVVTPVPNIYPPHQWTRGSQRVQLHSREEMCDELLPKYWDDTEALFILMQQWCNDELRGKIADFCIAQANQGGYPTWCTPSRVLAEAILRAHNLWVEISWRTLRERIDAMPVMDLDKPVDLVHPMIARTVARALNAELTRLADTRIKT